MTKEQIALGEALIQAIAGRRSSSSRSRRIAGRGQLGRDDVRPRDGHELDVRTTTAYTGAKAWWNAGYTGAGVDVAVIDTGVSPVEGLATPGKVVYGPDLSLESQAPNLRNLDTNGHGTFMAGLIAGKDSTLTAPYASAPASAYRGHGARRTDRLGQGRCRRRRCRRLAGDRGDQLGRPAPQRQRPQHPRHQPQLRHQLAAEVRRSTRSRSRSSRPGRRASSSSQQQATPATRKAGAPPALRTPRTTRS